MKVPVFARVLLYGGIGRVDKTPQTPSHSFGRMLGMCAVYLFIIMSCL